MSNDDTLFHKIKELNNLQTILPENVKKMKMNGDIIDLVFKKFSSKSISKTSSASKIIKEIYNTFFGCHIVNTKIDESKHVIYTVKPVFYALFDFACKYLILNRELNLTYNSVISDDDNGIDIA